MTEQTTIASSPLISATELADLVDGRAAGDPILLDVRWQLGREDGREQYLSGHIPGALYVDLPSQLAAPGSPTAGAHPLPAPDDLETALQSLGVTKGSTVVVYDDWGAQAAARAWWLLTAAGIENARVLDGGLTSWRAIEGPLESGETTVSPSSVQVHSYRRASLTIDEAETFPQHGVLLDARPAEHFSGEVRTAGLIAGHIPGALSAPAASNLDVSGHFLPPEQLRERFIRAGVPANAPLGVYCGFGVTATHNILALAIAGFDAALYPGSWSQWSQSGRPVVTETLPD